MGKKEKDQDINDILKDVRKNIKPPTGPLTSIDPKKLTKAFDDVKVVKEVEKIIENESNDKKEEK